MARVFLVSPPGAEPVRTPLLAFGYLASALRQAGHTVALLDAAAPQAPKEFDPIAAHIRAFGPDLVGIHAKTLSVQPAYALARHLRHALPARTKLVCGGPHATAVPDEPLAHGFDFSVSGEGEETLAELADALDGRRAVADVRGLGVRSALGAPKWGGQRGFLEPLDDVADPLAALDLFDPAWYGQTGRFGYGGLLSSRGCPAACTFCCNVVTGRRFRYRSAAMVGDEVRRLREGWGATALAFFDDSFAVGRRRVFELSEALATAGPVHWSCTAHPAHLDPEVLAAMKEGGLGGLDIGMEAAFPARLKSIGKGVTVERVLDVLGWCRDLGLHIVVNLMFGWPGETEAELDAAEEFLAKAAALGAYFNARGVLVPFPGTEDYAHRHAEFGFTNWWLGEPLVYADFPTAWDEAEIRRAYAADAALERNFFHHSEGHLARIQGCLDLKASLTYDRVRTHTTAAGAVPAAGAR
ncbi:MAG: B12-binding domain-containing radical SAM protein [Myxococcales bacterium]|nr:B12-binding domain-containing radical SAM protein [Myxococcales bacterium]